MSMRTEQSRQLATAAPTSSRKYGILVVDDDDGARNVLGAWMRHQGYSVWLADGGHQAIGLITRHGDAIDIVFMDVNLPDQDGPVTLASLRALNPRIRCCFMSADTGAYTEDQLRGMSDAALLRKPFRLSQIPSTIVELAALEDRPALIESDLTRDGGLRNGTSGNST